MSGHRGGRTTVVVFTRDVHVHDHLALAGAAAVGERVAPRFVPDDSLLVAPLPGRAASSPSPSLPGTGKVGRTGSPIVDAGVRQLAAQGRIHHRARLLPGSLHLANPGLDFQRDGASGVRAPHRGVGDAPALRQPPEIREVGRGVRDGRHRRST